MKDFLIIGQGIAGSLLSFEAFRRNLTFDLVDAGKPSASEVAAGLVNPVLIKRFKMVWQGDTALPLALDTYTQWEKVIKKPIIRPLDVLRKLSSVEEENQWFFHADKPHLSEYLGGIYQGPVPDLLAGFRLALLKGCYQVDVPVLLRSWRDFLIGNGDFIASEINENDLRFKEGVAHFQNQKYKAVVWCIGAYEKRLPGLVPNQGQYLSLNLEWPRFTAVHGKHFLVPQDQGLSVGATYSPGVNHWDEEEEKTEELKEYACAMGLPLDNYEVKVGVRPTVKDRKPLVGKSPDGYSWVLNGFGSRGMLMGPWLVKKLLDCILNDEELPASINSERY